MCKANGSTCITSLPSPHAPLTDRETALGRPWNLPRIIQVTALEFELMWVCMGSCSTAHCVRPLFINTRTTPALSHSM